MIKWHHFHLADNRDDFSPKSVLARRKSLVCLVMIFISVLCLVRCLVGTRSLGEKIRFQSSRSNSKWQVSDLRSPLPSHLDILLGFILKSNIKVNKFVGKCQFWSVKQQVTWMFDLISSKFAAKVEEFRRVPPSFTTSPRYHLSASLSHDSQTSLSLPHTMFQIGEFTLDFCSLSICIVPDDRSPGEKSWSNEHRPPPQTNLANTPTAFSIQNVITSVHLQ